MTREKPPFNYIFFGTFLLFLFLLSFSQLLSLSGGTFSFPLLFIGNVILQSLLEILLITSLSTLIATYFPRAFRSTFIALTTLLIFFHIIDFFLVRLIDFTIWFALDFVMEDKVKHFIELLNASNIPLLTWVAVFAAIGAFITLGLFLYNKTEILAKKRALPLSLPMQALALSTLLLTLFIWDYSTRPYFTFADSLKYEKALPLKFTFFNKSCPTLTTAAPLAPPPPHTLTTTLRPKYTPDIYLFIVESLREDCITPDITPHLTTFKEKNTSFDLALSAANATHLSWTSLFYSQLPFHWTQATTAGAPPLRLLKDMGYTIHVYTASELGYYRMEEVLFGKDHHLADTYTAIRHTNTHPAHVSDSRVIDHLLQDTPKTPHSPPRLNIIFLDSTHFDYSWPSTHTPFQPTVTGIRYWKAFFGKREIEGIKNRYKNALAHIDTLFGRIQNTLQATPRGRDALTIFTGDHGEEFAEKGFLFHGSHLSREQTHIPLYYSFGTLPIPPKQTELTSHIDIFPTLIHALCAQSPPRSLFQGTSIFSSTPFVITARYNAGRAPFEFFIHTKTHKLLLQFASPSHIHTCQEIKVLELTTSDDTPLQATPDQIKALFDPARPILFPSPL